MCVSLWWKDSCMNLCYDSETLDAPVDAARIRLDFPIFEQLVHGKHLVFLDSGASSQKPVQVLDAMDHVSRTTYANVHRGVYTFSERSTELYDQARERIAHFIGAPSAEQIVFTRNATEALNLIAYTYGRAFLRAGDEIVLTELEHHANLVPWLMLAKERGVRLRFIPLAPGGTLDLGALDALLTPHVKLVSFAHVSNVLGTITDPRPIVECAYAVAQGFDMAVEVTSPASVTMFVRESGFGLPQIPGFSYNPRPDDRMPRAREFLPKNRTDTVLVTRSFVFDAPR
jgi:selenocysteine lyase/cysteine desulfurase